MQPRDRSGVKWVLKSHCEQFGLKHQEKCKCIRFSKNNLYWDILKCKPFAANRNIEVMIDLTTKGNQLSPDPL